MLNAVPVRLRAVLADPMFAVSVLFCALLCSSAVIYTDAQNLNDYTAFTAPIYFSRAEMRTDLSFSAESVLRSCGAGWLGLFLPITSARFDGLGSPKKGEWFPFTMLAENSSAEHPD